MNARRHKWEKNVMKEGIPFVATYKVDKCTQCGCLKLHKLEGKMYFSVYVIKGKEFNKLPKCE